MGSWDVAVDVLFSLWKHVKQNSLSASYCLHKIKLPCSHVYDALATFSSMASPLSVPYLRCTLCGCWARTSRLRSFWAWATTSAQSSRWTTAASAPISTSACRAKTAPTTGLRSSSTEVEMIHLTQKLPFFVSFLFPYSIVFNLGISSWIWSCRFICVSTGQHHSIHNIPTSPQMLTLQCFGVIYSWLLSVFCWVCASQFEAVIQKVWATSTVCLCSNIRH